MRPLLSRIGEKSLLLSAWEKIKHRPDSKGFDGETIKDFENNLASCIKKIQEDLKNGYVFTPLKGTILKDDNRPIRIPSVRDRVVQKAIDILIRPRLNRRFKIENVCSFAYIKNRSIKDAALEIKRFHAEGRKWVYEADIKGFFNEVSLPSVLDMVFRGIGADASINHLIEGALKAELGNRSDFSRFEESVFPDDGIGLPQGGVLSPLFANVYLHELDQTMIDHGFKLIRYADDFLVMCETEEEAHRAHDLARSVVEEKLGLRLYELGFMKKGKIKSQIKMFQNVQFLGLVFQGENVFPSPERIDELKSWIRDIPRCFSDRSLYSAIRDIRSAILTWSASYSFTDLDENTLAQFDEHLFKGIGSLVRRFGLRFTGAYPNQSLILKAIGIPVYTQAFIDARERDKRRMEEKVKNRSTVESRKKRKTPASR